MLTVTIIKLSKKNDVSILFICANYIWLTCICFILGIMFQSVMKRFSVVFIRPSFILNFVHCEITACDSDNKQSLILSWSKKDMSKSPIIHSGTLQALALRALESTPQTCVELWTCQTSRLSSQQVGLCCVCRMVRIFYSKIHGNIT